MTHWEYLQKTVWSSSEIASCCNELGLLSWELVTVVPGAQIDDRLVSYTCVFKREASTGTT